MAAAIDAYFRHARLGSKGDVAAFSGMTASLPKTDISQIDCHVRFVPCVDVSKLPRAFFTLAAVVGAAMLGR